MRPGSASHEHTARRSERGQTLIEGALALTVFFSLLFGVIDCGLVLVRHQSLVERVRVRGALGRGPPLGR